MADRGRHESVHSLSKDMKCPAICVICWRIPEISSTIVLFVAGQMGIGGRADLDRGG